MTSTSATSTAMSGCTPARSTSEVANAVSAAAVKRFSAIVGMLPRQDRRPRTQGPWKPAGVILRCGRLRVAALARRNYRAPRASLTSPNRGWISQAGSGPVGASRLLSTASSAGRSHLSTCREAAIDEATGAWRSETACPTASLSARGHLGVGARAKVQRQADRAAVATENQRLTHPADPNTIRLARLNRQYLDPAHCRRSIRNEVHIRPSSTSALMLPVLRTGSSG